MPKKVVTWEAARKAVESLDLELPYIRSVTINFGAKRIEIETLKKTPAEDGDPMKAVCEVYGDSIVTEQYSCPIVSGE